MEPHSVWLIPDSVRYTAGKDTKFIIKKIKERKVTKNFGKKYLNTFESKAQICLISIVVFSTLSLQPSQSVRIWKSRIIEFSIAVSPVSMTILTKFGVLNNSSKGIVYSST